MNPAAGSPLRRGAGSALIAVGTAAAIFALTAPGGSSAETSRTVELGAGIRTLDVDLASAHVRVAGAAGETATLRVEGGEHVQHTLAGGTLRVRCAAERSCAGAHIVVGLPRAAGARIAVRDGSVAVERLDGPVALRSHSATLTAFDLRSPAVEVATGSGAVHVSLARVARTLRATSADAPLYLTVPYAYASDGYRVRAHTDGHADFDITRSKEANAPRIEAQSDTGDLLITQRYPNMS